MDIFLDAIIVFTYLGLLTISWIILTWHILYF